MRFSVVVSAWMMSVLGCTSSREPTARSCGDAVFADCFPTSSPPAGTFGRFVVETDPDRTLVAIGVRFRAEDGTSRGFVSVELDDLLPFGCDGELSEEGTFRFSAPVAPLVEEDGSRSSVCEVCGAAETWSLEIEVTQRDEGGERVSVHELRDVTLACTE